MMSQFKKLSIAFYWHMHQPVYQLTPNGDYLMPWVRLHAVKDYLDMALWVKKYNIKLNFNYVPVLLDALIDYENGAHDIHSRLTVTPVEQLNYDDKIFILNNFFDANYQNMILKNPQYHRLYKIMQQNGTEDVDIFSNQEYSDLMALFNLAWIDPSFKNTNPILKKMVAKGCNYSLEDRIQIIAAQRNIISKIIPTLKRLVKSNKIEITTSPYYHPILPILTDAKAIRKGYKAEDELADLNFESDALIQTKNALDRVEKIIGKRPKGIWASEQCVSKKTLEIFSKLGVEWSVSDESVLANSIDFEFVHDFKGYLEDPYHLLKSYSFKTSDIKMIFRDSTISSLISYEYAQHNPVATANDLYDRIKVIQSKIMSSPDNEHLLTIALDGENCWENYIEDGNEFLDTLYSLISEDKTLETVLISDYLNNAKESKELKRIIYSKNLQKGFKLWINEPVKDLAWAYLNRTNQDLISFSKREPNNPNLALARKEIQICQGSDWFWWYGEPNYSGRDNLFDFLYRSHLKNVYKYLELDPPAYLDEPLISVSASAPSNYPTGLISPKITGKNDDNELYWQNAGCIEIPDGPVLRESKLFDKICFGNDNDNFYLRFHLNQFIKDNPSSLTRTYQMYIYMRKAGRTQSLSPIRLINKSENISPISLEKFHNEIQISIRDNELRFLRLIKSVPGDMWVLENYKNMEVAYGDVLDVKIPFSVLEIEEGETLEFLFINANYGMTDFFIPNEMVLSVNRPLKVSSVKS